MDKPLEITFQGVEKSDAIEDKIAEKSAKLEKHFDRIVHCPGRRRGDAPPLAQGQDLPNQDRDRHSGPRAHRRHARARGCQPQSGSPDRPSRRLRDGAAAGSTNSGCADVGHCQNRARPAASCTSAGPAKVTTACERGHLTDSLLLISRAVCGLASWPALGVGVAPVVDRIGSRAELRSRPAPRGAATPIVGTAGLRRQALALEEHAEIWRLRAATCGCACAARSGDCPARPCS